MHLQRANARRELSKAFDAFALQTFHERVHAKAQGEIENVRTVFDQQVLVARLAIDDRGTLAVGSRARQNRFRSGLPDVRSGDRLRRGRCRSEEHTSELQSRENLVCRLLLEKKKEQAGRKDTP